MEDTTPRAWLSAVADNSSDAIIVLDKSRVIRFANKAAHLMASRSGYSRIQGTSYDEVIAQSRILNEDGRTPDLESLPTYLALRRGIATRDLVLEQVYGDQHYWLSITCVPLENASGTPEYAVVYFRDISERKAREDKLAFLLASSKILEVEGDQYAHIVENMRLMVPSLADWGTINVVSGHGLSRIAIMHRDPAKVPLVERLATLSADVPNGAIQTVLASGEPQFVPVVTDEVLRSYHAADSDERIALARQLKVSSSMILPIFSRGDVVGVLSLAYAESGRHYTEEDLAFMKEFCNHLGILTDNVRLYEEVRKRDKAKDAFLTTLSHELRNPLAPIKSTLELLALKNTDAELREELAVVEHQFDHLARLWHDLLDVSRYTLGKIKLERAPTPLRPLIETVIRAHQPFIERKGITLDVVMPDGEVPVFGDATRLEQAIMNLLHNAEKFTPRHGRISVVVEETPRETRVRVRDTGIGMNEAELATLFDINAQAMTHHQQQGGLGIGLVLVRQIMELHGGSVHGTSAGKGRGSEFVIVLPRTESAALPDALAAVS
jgi:PAS domain S-box-containing protein